MMGRKSRITPEQGAASGKKDSRNTGQHTDGDPEGEGQARMALGEVLSMPDMGADEGSTRGGPRLGKRSKAQGASSGM